MNLYTKAVSYTHLDVYKRQAPQTADAGIAVAAVALAAAACFVAVKKRK